MKKLNFKLEKFNNFKNFKVKPMILAIAVAGSLAVGGITVGLVTSHNSGNVTPANPTTSSTVDVTNPSGTDDKNGVTITSVNTYKLNLGDFDKVVTPAFDRDASKATYDIKDCDTTTDGYSIKLSDGSTIVATLDDSLLVDTDYKPREQAVKENDIGAMFDKALVNYYDKVEDLNVDALSLDKLDNENVFTCDTKNGRLLNTTNNIIPYHVIDATKAMDMYHSDQEYLNAYIEIDGQLIDIAKVIGFKDVEINGSQFRIICGIGLDNFCREYLTTKDQCILIRRASNSDVAEGVQLGYENATGNYLMKYRKDLTFYRRIKDVVLQKDNTYNILTEDLVYIVPARLYSFEFRDKMNLIPKDAETLDVSKYTFLAYDQASFDVSILSSKKQLVKVGETYLYVVDQPINAINKMNGDKDTAIPDPVSAVYNADSSVLARVITADELKSNYSLANQPIDFSLNIAGNSFSDDAAGGRYVAFKEVNMLGLECYAMVREFTDPKDNTTKYLEVIAPKDYVLVKGSDQDISKMIK